MIVLPNNLTVTGILIAYWRPDLNVSIWIVVFGVAIIALNVRTAPLFFTPLTVKLTIPVASSCQLLR